MNKKHNESYYNQYYDNEETVTDDTQFDESNQESNNRNMEQPNNTTEEKEPVSYNNTWKRAAAGAGVGVAAGIAGAMLWGQDNTDTNALNDTNHNKSQLSHPEWVDDKIAVSNAANDDMSFNQAFAAARADVGAGGVFEWRGGLYGTYYANEWSKMTPEEKAEYNSHFSWGKGSNHDNHAADTNTSANSIDDINIVSVEHEDKGNDTDVIADIDSDTVNIAEVDAADADIEILGVSNDIDSNTIIGNITIDGQDVILIDVDNDMAFDYMGVDNNQNGIIDPDEIIDIHDSNVSVNDLEQYYDPGCNIADIDNSDFNDNFIYEG